MHILIIDHSVLAYKCFLKLFSQDYEGETNDEIQEFTSQYVHEIVYLHALHNPDAMLWVLDCPRADVWRHQVVRRYYGPRLNVRAIEWNPGTEDKCAENACTWIIECDNSYGRLWLDAAGAYKFKRMPKKDYTPTIKQLDEDDVYSPMVTDRETLKAMLPRCAPMYKGNREGAHWPQSAVMDKPEFTNISRELAATVAPFFNGKVAEAPALEADDLAYTAVKIFGKHDLTTVTTDRDWLQLSLFHKGGTFQAWEPNLHEFLDTDRAKVLDLMLKKLMTGDKSDNIKSMRLQGKTAGIGPTKADALIKDAPKPVKKWLKENGEPDSMARNETLVNLANIPADLYKVACDAIRNAKKPAKRIEQLAEIVSEATLTLAKSEGQRQRQKIAITDIAKENSEDA